MAIGFWPSDLVLIGVQASLVAGPQMEGVVPSWLVRQLRASAWAAVIPVSLGFTVAVLILAPRTAGIYTWLALVAVPVLAIPPVSALIVAHVHRRRRVRRTSSWGLAGSVVTGLFMTAWLGPGLTGQAAAVALTALSCVTLATALGQLAPVPTLKLGVVLLAALDSVLVFGQVLEQPNDTLNQAAPTAGLPQLQFAGFGSAVIGYGDLFAAAVLGVIVARQAAGPTQSRERLRLSLVTLACSVAFDALFLVVHVLPATVPVAAALLTDEVRHRSSAHRRVSRQQRP